MGAVVLIVALTFAFVGLFRLIKWGWNWLRIDVSGAFDIEPEDEAYIHGVFIPKSQK